MTEYDAEKLAKIKRNHLILSLVCMALAIGLYVFLPGRFADFVLTMGLMYFAISFTQVPRKAIKLRPTLIIAAIYLALGGLLLILSLRQGIQFLIACVVILVVNLTAHAIYRSKQSSAG